MDICVFLSYKKPPIPFKALHFRYRIKNHTFKNNLQGLQKVIVKDFSWNISPWNALLFEKTSFGSLVYTITIHWTLFLFIWLWNGNKLCPNVDFQFDETPFNSLEYWSKLMNVINIPGSISSCLVQIKQ